MTLPSFLGGRLRRRPFSLLPAALVCAATARVSVVLNDVMFHHDFACQEIVPAIWLRP